MANREQIKKQKENKQEEKQRKSLDQKARMDKKIYKKKLPRVLKSCGPAEAAEFAQHFEVEPELRAIASRGGLMGELAEKALAIGKK